MEKIKKQKNLNYPLKGFRLAETTIKALAGLKEKTGKSYNLLMLDMVATYKRFKKFKKVGDHKPKQEKEIVSEN